MFNLWGLFGHVQPGKATESVAAAASSEPDSGQIVKPMAVKAASVATAALTVPGTPEAERKRKMSNVVEVKKDEPAEKRGKADDKVAVVAAAASVAARAASDFEQKKGVLIGRLNEHQASFVKAPVRDTLFSFGGIRQAWYYSAIEAEVNKVFKKCSDELAAVKENSDVVRVLHKYFHVMWKAKSGGSLSQSRLALVNSIMEEVRKECQTYSNPITADEEKGVIVK